MRHVRFASVFATIVIAAVVSTGVDAQTQGPFVRQVIPYNGILELDGVAVNGEYRLRFALHETLDGAGSIWTADIAVSIVAGRFSTLLGRDGSIPDDVFQHDGLYLSLAIEDPNADGSFIDLVNRQHIVPTPYSYIAAEASDFTVRGELTVGGAARTGTLDVIGSAAADSLVVTGNASAGSLDVTGPASTDSLTVADLESAGPIRVTAVDGSIQVNLQHALADDENGRLSVVNASTGDYANLAVQDLAVHGNIDVGLQLSGQYHAERNNTTGSTDTQMISTTRSMCFLVRAGYEDLDSNQERANCQIFASTNGHWYLRANLGPTSDSNVWCDARCLSW